MMSMALPIRMPRWAMSLRAWRLGLGQTVEANVQNDPAIIDEVARLLITVKEGWDAIGDEVAPV